MVRLKEYKELTKDKAIIPAKVPLKVYLALSQHTGKICSPLIKKDDTVQVGQMIATSEGGIFSPVHSSISGKVIAIDDWPHPVLGRCKTIIIESDGLERPSSVVRRPSKEANKLTSDEIRNIVFEAGIVGLGGAGFPTHIKLNPPRPIDSLLINGCECEPYLTCDDRLMLEKTEQILKGIELIKHCVNPKEVYIAIEDNKAEAIKQFRYKIPDTRCQLQILKSKYPQGGEKQLIKNILNREVPSGKLPFEVGVVVHNVATAFSIYEAIYLGKPLYERVITVTGSCLENPGNFLVRLGTPIKDLIEQCKPREKIAKVIVGGPMMGVSQFSLDTPVIKGTSGILVFTRKEVSLFEEDNCIRCGECIYNCPAYLMPTLINQAARKEKFAQAKELGAFDCIECGLCSYVCPARIELLQGIKYAKARIPK